MGELLHDQGLQVRAVQRERQRRWAFEPFFVFLSLNPFPTFPCFALYCGNTGWEIMLKRLLCQVALANERCWKEIGCNRKTEARVCLSLSLCFGGYASSSSACSVPPASSGQSHCGSSFTWLDLNSRLWSSTSFLFLSSLGEAVASYSCSSQHCLTFLCLHFPFF